MKVREKLISSSRVKEAREIWQLNDPGWGPLAREDVTGTLEKGYTGIICISLATFICLKLSQKKKTCKYHPLFRRWLEPARCSLWTLCKL